MIPISVIALMCIAWFLSGALVKMSSEPMQVRMIEIRKRVYRLVAIVLFLTSLPAYAQPKTYEDKLRDDERRKQEDAGYKRSIQRIPSKEVIVDPWGIVRPEDPKTSSPSRQKKQ
jgi:hypothetical protein